MKKITSLMNVFTEFNFMMIKWLTKCKLEEITVNKMIYKVLEKINHKSRH